MAMPAKTSRGIRRGFAVFLPLLAGVLVLVVLIAQRTPAQRRPAAEIVRSVSVIEAPATAWRPRATGFGEARPARTWRAVTEVSGRIVERNEQVETGAILAAGTTLFRIDRADYELAVAEAEAALAVRRAQLEELDTRRDNVDQSLAIERRQLKVVARELERQQRLLDQDSVSQAEVDRQQRAYLQQRQAVQDLENTLARIPAERRRIEAERESARTRLERARRDLPRTTISAPFDLRVSEAKVETGQYVRTGETLVRADGVGATEVEAEVPVSRFRAILAPGLRRDTRAPATLDRLLDRMELSAEVRLRATGGDDAMARWQARVDRISDAIDPRTRTVGVVVVVERPYANARPPEKPPLVKGMYVEVGLCAPRRDPAVVLPRTALHGDRVYVADEDDRLAIREPTLRFRGSDFVVIDSGIQPGERVVLSDPVPAIAEMKLAPEDDVDARGDLIDSAQGARDCP